LIVAAGHFDHNLKRLIAQIIGQIGTNSKSQHAAAIELSEQLNGLECFMVTKIEYD